MSSLEDLPPGSRIYLVKLFDPTLGKIVVTATMIEPDRLDGIDKIAADNDTPFAVALQRVAAAQVAMVMYGGNEPPVGFLIKSVGEVSVRELRAMKAEADERAKERGFD